MNLIRIWLSFLKIGCVGFGGGSALIPIVRNELVAERQWLSDDEYLKHTLIANITPGA
ncbi:MAG: chromate transporter, partial [Planctomycetota bacterium]|nr:chromate transporter [Planctomycetota bacterium]